MSIVPKPGSLWLLFFLVATSAVVSVLAPEFAPVYVFVLLPFMLGMSFFGGGVSKRNRSAVLIGTVLMLVGTLGCGIALTFGDEIRAHIRSHVGTGILSNEGT